MGFLDKIRDAMRLGGDDYDDDYEDDYDDFDDDYEEEKPERKRGFKREQNDDLDFDKFEQSEKQRRELSVKKFSKKSGNGMEVCVIKPTSFEESKEITDTLLSNCTVVLNFEGIDGDIAQRIIDFTSGSCYAIGGHLQKVSNYIFLITPKSVDISGDLQDILSGSIDIPTVYGKF